MNCMSICRIDLLTLMNENYFLKSPKANMFQFGIRDFMSNA